MADDDAPRRLRRSPVKHFTDDIRRAAVDAIDAVSIDVQTLQSLVYVSHHRCRGDKAHALHRLLGEYAIALVEYTDVLTELVEQLGGESSGTVEELADGTRLEPFPKGVADGPEIAWLVLDRSSVVLAYAEQAISTLLGLGMQAAANDVMTVQSGIQKWAWKVGAGLPLEENLAQQVYEQLAEDFPSEAIDWVLHVDWEGPVVVPLADIDSSGRDKWTATQEPERVQKFVDVLNDGGKVKPLVLVQPPGDMKALEDGHHRYLALEKAGRTMGMAYVAAVPSKKGPWKDMHAQQNRGPSKQDEAPVSERTADQGN
jgi:DNA-binding ferritin-like protein